MPVYKDEKRNSWFCTFYYTDWQGNKKKKKKEGFKLKREAQDFEREFIKQQSGSCDMSFKSLAEIYKNDCKTRLKPTTFLNKESTVNNLLVPFFDTMPVNQITATHIRKWQNELIDKGYSQTYLRAVNNNLSTVFNFAIKYYGLTSNPVKTCGTIGKAKADTLNFWTLDEYHKFVETIDKLPYLAAFEMLFWTGMRSGELMALTLNDFDLENHTVSINKNYARFKKEDLILTPKTTKSRRTVYITPHLAELIDKYSKTKYDYEPSDRLFDFPKERLTRRIEKNCVIAGLRKIRLHDLRHSHASLLIELGYSPLLISERLGHENIETTLKVYSHLYPNKQKDLVDELQKLCK